MKSIAAIFRKVPESRLASFPEDTIGRVVQNPSARGTSHHTVAGRAGQAAVNFLPAGERVAARTVSDCRFLQGVTQAVNLLARWG